MSRVWNQATLASLPTAGPFRLRGVEMTRAETFVDAAFAFSVTLLVISVDSVPESYDEFVSALKDIPAFVAGFLQMIMFWLGHRAWSRRFGLDDMLSVWLSLLLVAGILVIVYPLRVMFAAGITNLTEGYLAPTSFAVTLPQIGTVFAVYGVGFGVLCGLISLLYARAYQLRDRLCLNATEQFHTRWDIYSWSILSATGFVACALALTLDGESVVLAGWIYVTLGFVMPVHAYRRGHLAKQIPAE